jgi:hypothetical protein
VASRWGIVIPAILCGDERPRLDRGALEQVLERAYSRFPGNVAQLLDLERR